MAGQYDVRPVPLRPSLPPPVLGGGARPSAPIVPLVMPKTPPAMRLHFPGAIWRPRS